MIESSWVAKKKWTFGVKNNLSLRKKAQLNEKIRLKDGYTFRCGSNHEFNEKKTSFFERSSYNIRNLLYNSLNQCALSTGMDYKHKAVNWASYIWQLFCQYVFDANHMIIFEGR